MKYYARQIEPEYQTRPLEFDGIDTDYINITGNRHYTERVSLLFEAVRDALHSGEISEAWNEENERGPLADAIRDIIPPHGRGEYTQEEAENAAQIATDYYYGADENASICDLLEIVTGQPWKWCTLRGCCQGDWVEAFYPANAWTRETLEAFETEYFNTGTEWEIHDGDDAPDDPEEISGYSVYCHAWRDDDRRAELAAAIGCEPSDVIMYAFEGYTRTAVYKEVSA